MNNDTGFFQGGKSFGGKGFLGPGGMLSEIGKKFKDKPFAGIPGVCPYTGKPLQSPTEQQTGVADEVSQAGGNIPPLIGRTPAAGNPLQNAMTQQPQMGMNMFPNSQFKGVL